MMEVIDHSDGRFVVKGYGYNERQDISQKNKIETLPANEYFYLKLIEFGGDRIKHDFGNGTKVLETYSEMIFNVTYKDFNDDERTFHSKPPMAKKICAAIQNNLDNPNDVVLISEVIAESISGLSASTEFDAIWLESLLKTYKDKVFVTDKGFVVNKSFLIDRQGSAHYYVDSVRNEMEASKTKLHYLCIHAPYGHETNDKVIIANGVPMKVTELSQTILSKINYLINPPNCDYKGHPSCDSRKTCKVFIDQLPKFIKEKYKRA